MMKIKFKMCLMTEN